MTQQEIGYPRRHGCWDYKGGVTMAFLKASSEHGIGLQKRLRKDANRIILGGETETPRSEQIMGTPASSSRAKARAVSGRREEKAWGQTLYYCQDSEHK